MLPNQASMPLRRMLRPCIRLYQQQCASGVKLTGSEEKAISSSSYKHTSATFHFTDSQHRLSAFLADQKATVNVRCFSTSCTFCDVAHEHAEQVEKKSMQHENGEKAQVIQNASLKQLKTLAPTVENAYYACLVLQRLGELHKEGGTLVPDTETLFQEAWLQRVSQLVDQNIMKLSPRLVLSTLRSMYEVTTADVYLVKSLTIQVQWLLRRLPIPALIQVMQLHLSHQETPLRANVLQQCITTLERRWVELTNPKDIVLLMYAMQDGPAASQSLQERLEDRALDVVEKASSKELYRILYILSRKRHRNTPLIRAVVYHLNKLSPVANLSTVQLTNLAFALAKLTVYDVPILTKLSEEICKRPDDLTPKLVTSLLESFSHLRWKESMVFQLLLNKAGQLCEEQGYSSAKQKQALSATDQAGIILSLAHLNIDSEQSKTLVSQLARSREVQALRGSSPSLWLEVTWAMAVLRVLDTQSAASVLSEDFWSNFSEPESFQSMVNLTKLNNINTAAKYEVEGYSGPFLPNTLTACDAKLLQKGERKAAEKMVSALTNMAPLESYTHTNVTTPGGYLIDAEFHVSSNGEPISLSQLKNNLAGSHKVALKVLEFPDLTLVTSDLTGLHAMAARHLRRQGYTVVQVNHTDISSKSKVVELVQLLQRKVKDALKVTQPAS